VANALFLTCDLGDLRETARCLSRLRGPVVKALHPRDAALVLYVGGCLLQHLGRREEALLGFKGAMDADPTEPRFRAAIAELRAHRPTPSKTPAASVRWTPWESG
jgi:hypothetical protein